MYSLDYQLHIFYHICTAYIIDSTDVITNAQLRLSTQHILSQVYSLDYLLHRFIINVQLRLSTPQI
jgi:hypothetical protein